MAIQDKDRNAFIALVEKQPQSIKDIAAVAFALGHEEGWWLARTDPDSTVSPVEHSNKTNPFISTDPAAHKNEVLDLPETSPQSSEDELSKSAEG